MRLLLFVTLTCVFLGAVDAVNVLFEWRNKKKNAEEIVIFTEQETIKRKLLPDAEYWSEEMSEDKTYSLIWVAIRWKEAIKMFYFNEKRKLREINRENILRIKL